MTWAIFKTLNENLVDRNKIKVSSAKDYHRIQAKIVSNDFLIGNEKNKEFETEESMEN